MHGVWLEQELSYSTYLSILNYDLFEINKEHFQ